MVDRAGVRISLLFYASLLAVGQVVFTLGLQVKSWPIIFLGRLIFGFGGESFTVANSALLSEWFKGRELAFAFGVNLAISKLGSVINNILSPILAEQVGIVFALWFGAILCGGGILCVLLTIPIDKSMDKRIAYDAVGQKEQGADDEGSVSTEGPKVSFRDALLLPHIFWILVISCVVVYGCILPFNNISSSLLLERDYFKETDASCHLQDAFQCEGIDNPPISCPSSKFYQPPLPYNATVAGDTYDPLDTSDIDCSSDDWKNGCTSEYCSRQNDAISTASITMSIPYIISAVLSPPLGYLIDIYGMRAVISLVAPIILIVVHALLGYTTISPIGPLVGQGLAYTGFVSVLWPAIPLVVTEEVTGLAFGIVSSMQNLATAVIPLIVAQIYSDSGDKYIPNVELLFVILAVVGVVVGVYMNYYDYYYGNNILNSPCLIEADEDEEEKLLDVVADNGMQSALLPAGGRAESEDRRSKDLTHRTARHSSSDHHHKHHRGTSFTAYEEVMRGGGYRTETTSSRNNSTSHH